jgi:GntR family negative regulator for fad regulon and positive regulator of fabA
MTSYQMAQEFENIMKTHSGLPLRPTQHAEHFLIVAILDGTYPQGTHLPSERVLAKQIGVTRPTLRETLQRLASEKWVTIQHGKPTRVNDFWQEGGLSMLSTLAKYSDCLPNGFITHLLELRATLLPTFARLAARKSPHELLRHLAHCNHLVSEATAYARYDWELQTLMARHSGNPVYLLILNDFSSVFHSMAMEYFNHARARRASLTFYQELTAAIRLGGPAVSRLVAEAMAQSVVLWEEIRGGSPLHRGDHKTLDHFPEQGTLQ